MGRIGIIMTRIGIIMTMITSMTVIVGRPATGTGIITVIFTTMKVAIGTGIGNLEFMKGLCLRPICVQPFGRCRETFTADLVHRRQVTGML